MLRGFSLLEYGFHLHAVLCTNVGNHMFVQFFPPFSAAAQRGPWPPHSWCFLITRNDASQSVGLLWTSDQLVAETSTRQHTTLTTDKHPCAPVGFEPMTSAGERTQTYALERAATATGVRSIITCLNIDFRLTCRVIITAKVWECLCLA